MGRYDNEGYNESGIGRQRDLVLSTNEFCFLQSKTNGAIKTYTGPITMTISAQESLVVFNPRTKRFEETTDFEKARQLFTSAPEGWYVVLKNPSVDGSYPEVAKAVNSPELKIGRKINISGPCSFSLFPGQMAKVVQGHRLRSNQYLLARVYDADAAKKNITSATVVNAEGSESKETSRESKEYYVGQLLVIKGTEVSFYMPPTGIEVLAVGQKDGRGDNYIREAVTLERLEYAILKDEDGEKRYVHGPAVVFPEPTETFVETPSGGTIFRALELSPISGIYVKVIAEYEENGVVHPIGEELFITGKDQMIYYPRPEHAMIQYDGKYMHHAIAIPEGEGRYILNRLTGKITTIKGPNMYLPDPRTEVVVKRKLSAKECALMYPNNDEVLLYNEGITEKAVEKNARRGVTETSLDTIYATSNQASTLAIFEANANISRGTSYTKPRTIVLDTKYSGAVSIDVWTGYAVNVVSKTGKNKIVVGPASILLDYEETLEGMSLSTGKPKTTDNLINTAYLRIENNKISDIVSVQTKDFVNATFKVSYCVDFLKLYRDNWFKVENYVKYLCDRLRSLLKREAKKYTIEEFFNNSIDIIRKVVLNESDEKVSKETEGRSGRFFKENGMLVHDVEVLNVAVDKNIMDLIHENQNKIIAKTLKLTSAEKEMELTEKLAEYRMQTNEIDYTIRKSQIEQEQDLRLSEIQKKKAISEKEDQITKEEKERQLAIQESLNEISRAELARIKEKADANNEIELDKAKLKRDDAKNYAETIATIMQSISPDLTAALNSQANIDIMKTLGAAVSPYAIANGENIGETVNTLLRGTSLQKTLENVKICK